MCFRFDSCFGVHVPDDDDYYGPSPVSKGAPVPPHHATAATNKTPPSALRNGHYHSYDSNGHHAQPGLHRGNAHYTAAYHPHPARADEADYPRASNDARRGPAAPAPVAGRAAAATRSDHGYASVAQEKARAYTAAADEALKRPAAARNNKVVIAHGAGNGARYYYYEHEQPDRKEVTKDYYYPTATATTDPERY